MVDNRRLSAQSLHLLHRPLRSVPLVPSARLAPHLWVLSVQRLLLRLSSPPDPWDLSDP
jgi:hypothetical protein